MALILSGEGSVMGVSHRVTVTIRDRLGGLGFTFFTDPAGGPEIYVAAKTFEKCGFGRSAVKKNAKAIIDFETYGNGRRRALVVHKIEGSDQLPPEDLRAARSDRKDAPTPGAVLTGRVKKLKHGQEYGFIRYEGGDYFFHFKHLPPEIEREMVTAGSRFEFEVLQGRDGKLAAKLIKKL